MQNQLHWAIHGETAAETIYRRADSKKEYMGLTTWKDAPNGKIQKFDVVVERYFGIGGSPVFIDTESHNTMVKYGLNSQETLSMVAESEHRYRK